MALKRTIEDFFIEYCEKFIDGTERICTLCELEGTHCEGRNCDEAYDNYMSVISRKELLKDVRSDFDWRNKYSRLSLSNKVKLKMYLIND